MSYINDLENVKERLRIACNRYLPSEERLPVNCTLQDIADVFDKYDEASYMNAFLNSIEVFPDKDYSINDTEGHIKGLRPYAFYNNTALKSALLYGIASVSANYFTGCSNLEALEIPLVTTVTDNSCFASLTKLAKANLGGLAQIAKNNLFSGCTGLVDVDLHSLNKISWGAGSMFINCSALVNINLPALNGWSESNSFDTFKNCTSLKTVLIGGTGSIIANSLFSGDSALQAIILTNDDSAFTMSNSSLATEIIGLINCVIYVPNLLLTDYASATNWVTINNARPIQDIESHINSLRELGADFSYTPYANKKWDGTQLVTDSTIGEVVDK